jgi:hypothetical protein
MAVIGVEKIGNGSWRVGSFASHTSTTSSIKRQASLGSRTFIFLMLPLLAMLIFTPALAHEGEADERLEDYVPPEGEGPVDVITNFTIFPETPKVGKTALLSFNTLYDDNHPVYHVDSFINISKDGKDYFVSESIHNHYGEFTIPHTFKEAGRYKIVILTLANEEEYFGPPLKRMPFETYVDVTSSADASPSTDFSLTNMLLIGGVIAGISTVGGIFALRMRKRA